MNRTKTLAEIGVANIEGETGNPADYRVGKHDRDGNRDYFVCLGPDGAAVVFTTKDRGRVVRRVEDD